MSESGISVYLNNKLLNNLATYYLNIGLFKDGTDSDHSNTKLVCYSDPYYTFVTV